MNKLTQKYMLWQREYNVSSLTWREFYNQLYGECWWMETKQYGGAWLDKIMGEA